MMKMNMRELSRIRTIFHFNFMLNQSRIENFTAARSENIVWGGTQEEIYLFEIITGESWPQPTSSKLKN